MSLNKMKHLIAASALAIFVMAGVSTHAYAQKGGVGQLFNEVTWPTGLTVTAGAAANDNWQKSGTFSVDGQSFDQSHGIANPSFSVGMEIPILQDVMFAPRIAYNDYSF